MAARCSHAAIVHNAINWCDIGHIELGSWHYALASLALLARDDRTSSAFVSAHAVFPMDRPWPQTSSNVADRKRRQYYKATDV